MKLFYLPGSCALGPHIALQYSGLAYETVRVERGRKTDPAYLAINPLGRVPALVTETHGTITEAPVVLSTSRMLTQAVDCCRQLGRQNDMRLCAGWRTFRVRFIPPSDASGGRSDFVARRAARAQWNMRQRHNWPMTSLTSTNIYQTGSGLREILSPPLISISSFSDAWASGFRRAHAIF
jgi:hypothetical protein